MLFFGITLFHLNITAPLSADDEFFSPTPKKWHATLPPPPPPGDAPTALEDSDSDDENWLENAKREHLS